MPKVLGIDLSLTCTGIAVADKSGIARTEALKWTGGTSFDLSHREGRIYDFVNRVKGVVDREYPDMAVIEAPSFGSSYGSAHDRSGLWWAIVRMLSVKSVPVAQVTPKQRAKYGTGNGNSQKKEVHQAVKLRYGRDDLPIKTNDEADAVLLAAMGIRSLGFPIDGELDSAYSDAMVKVVWPL